MAERPRPCHEPAKRARLGHGFEGPPAHAENGQGGSDEDEANEEDIDRELEPEEILTFEFEDVMKNVVHEPQLGSYAPPAKASSGCAYAAHNSAAMPLPQHGVVGGILRLADVPGSRLEYTVSLEVGVMLRSELYDSRSDHGFVRFARVMDMHETLVPRAQRGKGHAKRLARAAFAVAHAHGFRVRPSCSYISDTFLAASPAQEYDVWHGRRCDELLLFTCCPEGKALEERRRQLSEYPMAQLRSRCQSVGAKTSGAKHLMVERLLGREFGPAAERRERALADQELCRERAGLGCRGCRACRGEGSKGWVLISDEERELKSAPRGVWMRRRRDDVDERLSN